METNTQGGKEHQNHASGGFDDYQGIWQVTRGLSMITPSPREMQTNRITHQDG